jgi:zinc transport system substrate-binding protein
MIFMKSRRHRTLGAALLPMLVVVALVAGCSGGGLGLAGAARPEGLTVLAGFYPLQYVAERVGGGRVRVTSLTRPGAEPHDLELTPRDVAALQSADLVIYQRGLQPAVDDAVAGAAPRATLDAAGAAGLDLTLAGQGTDPHFWLDPQRLAAVAGAVARSLTAADPAGARTFAANLRGLRTDLAALDRQLRIGLAHCANTDLVTSHAAFGYLARRYGLRQVGIAGLAPGAEPDARRLADVARLVRERGVRTVYYETLVDPAVARTVAREAGAGVAVLDPIEGLSAASRGRDYLQVMRANLASLRQGQSCR